MLRPFDHLVLPCPDLAAAAATFEGWGFQVSRRNRHPWGTENHIVQFPGAFLELIALAPDYVPVSDADEAFPFAGFLAGQAASTDPSGMIVLRSADAVADAVAFAADGIGSGRMLRFSREAAAPDGTLRRVAFTLAFAQADGMPDVGFFVCEQHYPENFWNPAFQVHPNGATGFAAVTLVSPAPADHVGFLAAFSGQQAMRSVPGGLAIDLGNAAIEVVDPSRRPTPARSPRSAASPRLVGLRFAVAPGRSFAGRVGTVDIGFEVSSSHDPLSPGRADLP